MLVRLAQSLLLTVAPHGGQHAARRNAWASMVADAQRGRARREAHEAMEVAQRRSVPRAVPAGG